MSNTDLGQESPNTGDTAPIEAMSDQFGNKAEIDTDKYPDDAAASKGEATRPSGQGGATPKSRPDYQDQFPANPEPSDYAKEWGDKVNEMGAVRAHSEAISDANKNVEQTGPESER